MAALGLRDVTLRRSSGVGYVGIPIMKSMADQDEVGSVRNLEIAKLALCPVTRMKNWLGGI